MKIAHLSNASDGFLRNICVASSLFRYEPILLIMFTCLPALVENQIAAIIHVVVDVEPLASGVGARIRQKLLQLRFYFVDRLWFDLHL
jgi:hypothetical protein